MTISCSQCGYEMFDVSSSLNDIVKTEQNSPVFDPLLRETGSPVTPVPIASVKDAAAVEASGAQPRLDAATKREILNLYNSGLSVPRIKQVLGLSGGLAAIYGVVNKKRK